MEHLQRGVLILMVCLVAISPTYIRYMQNQYYIETWLETQTECFFEEVCCKGYFTTEEYVAFCNMVRSAHNGEEIFFEEYQRVFGWNGMEYRVFISWEEIKKELEKWGRYSFQADSEIRFYMASEEYCGLVRSER